MLLVVSMFSVLVVNSQAPAGGILDVDVPVRGTFLRAINDWPYYAPGDFEYDEDLEMNVGVSTNYHIESPAIVDLRANGFDEGDQIIISHNSTIYPCGALNPSNPEGTACGVTKNDDIHWGGLLGIFSATSDLKPINEEHRVPGAVDSGRHDFKTPQTFWSGALQKISDQLQSKNINWYTGPMDTDIPEDFLIRSHLGMYLTIPQNARFLFLSSIGVLYRDNLGEIKVTIEKDSDGDGLPDSWEQNGVDVDKDGHVDLDLPLMGAHWNHKDVFVEIDYMGSSGGHNHNPWDGAIDDVKRAFANAPVTNPDGSIGISLHVLEDQEVPHQTEINWTEFYKIKNTSFGTQKDQDSPNKTKILKAKGLVFHYCLFAHLQKGDTWSGRGEIFGNDFMVTLGAFTGSTGNREEQAATFMHELGHNLGLEHGGEDSQNFKPNYLSIMNYMFMFEFRNVATRPLDFSRIKLDTINETNLNEAKGLGVSSVATYETQWYETGYSWMNLTTGSRQLRVVPLKPIDYFDDGNLTVGGSYNLNTYPQWNFTTGWDELKGYDDWQNLHYMFRGSAVTFGDGPNPSMSEDEMTYELAEAIRNEARIIETNGTPIEPNSLFGVKKGDWMEYSISYIGDTSDDYWHKIRIEVKDVPIDDITLSWEIELLNGESISFTETYDFAEGVNDLMIIEANLEVGDQFYHEQVGIVVIEYIEDYNYAGEERTVIWARFSDFTTHWDKITGVTTQAEWTSPSGMKIKWLLEKTSLWGSTGTGLDLALVVGLVGAIAAILLIVFLFLRRKKKTTEKT